MLKYILAFLLIVLVWAIFIIIPSIPFWVPLVATSVIVGVLVVLFAVRKWRARRAARDIERALTAQAEEQAASAKPEQQAQIRAMQTEFLRALNALKTSKLGKNTGPDALYQLPWYVIIGPPGSGKTTAIRASGLQFPFAGGQVKGVGGTRNCDWWMTNDGLILDTAGRWLSEDDDRDEWLNFLDLLKRYRERKPVNGVVVAVAVSDLADAHDEDIQRIARQARDRVEEVMSRLEMVVPVYLMFTKSDLIDGFVETFSDLKKSERGQIWGYTVPVASKTASPGELFKERFDEMVRIVEQRSLKRVGQERKLEHREKIYVFPQQLELMRNSLATFVNELFAAGSTPDTTPIMRGVYFTSGTQEGKPLDRALKAIQDAFNVRPRAGASAAPATETKSYFLQNVFSGVIFPDQELAFRSAAERTRSRRTQLWALGGSLLLATLALAIPLYAYTQNKKMLTTLDRAREEVAKFRRENRGQAINATTLAPLRDNVEQLDNWERTGRPPLRLRFGMYQGHAVFKDISDLYKNSLRDDVMSPIFARDVEELNTFAERFSGENTALPDGAQAQIYNALKLYLLMTRGGQDQVPRMSVGNNPRRDDANLTLALDHFTDAWASQVRASNEDEDVPPELRNQMRQHVRFYMRLYTNPNNDGQRFAYNDTLVRRVRLILTRVSSTTVALEQVKLEANNQYPPICLSTIIGRTATSIRSTAPDNQTNAVPPPCSRGEYFVPGAFTRRAWEGYVRTHLTETFQRVAGEAWVLGDTSNVVERQRQQRTQLARLRSDYLNEYALKWYGFIDSLSVATPADHIAALDMLQQLTRGEPPVFNKIMREVGVNTHLEEPATTQNQAAQGAVGVLSSWLARVRDRQTDARERMFYRAQEMFERQRANFDNTGTDHLLTREELEAFFVGFSSFGYSPPPPPAPTITNNQQAPAPPPAPAPLPVAGYNEQLALVRDGVQTYVDNPNSQQVLQPMLTALQNAQTRVEALIQTQDVGWRPTFQRILRPPIDFTAERAVSAVGQGTGINYCSAVYMPFRRKLWDRYPFNRDGHDAAIADVDRFYHPNTGFLPAFYGTRLQNDIPRVGDHHEYAQTLRRVSSDIYEADLIPFLDRSFDIQTMLYPNAGQPPPPPAAGAEAGADAAGIGVDFEVRIRPTPTIAIVTFDVDGQSIEYQNGPEQWHRMHWPGTGRNRGASMRVRGAQNIEQVIQQEGEWGLFRLIEQGTVVGNPAARLMSVTWTLHDQNLEVGVDIRPTSADNPFTGIPRPGNDGSLILAPFRDPRAIAPPQIARGIRNCDPSGAISARDRPRRRRGATPAPSNTN